MIRSLFYLSLSFTLLFGLNAQQSIPSQVVSVAINQESFLNETLNFAQKHQEFRDLHFKQQEAEFVRLIREGQNPKILFIGCSDSRVVPELILKARPGDIFVIRTAGNFVPPFISQSVDGVAASVQYAVEVLNIPHIIVCGHSHCGAIRGLFQDLDPNKLGEVKRWIKLGEEAKRITMENAKPGISKEDIYKTTEEVNVLTQLENLMTFSFIKKAVDEGRIILHGWYFDIEFGQILYYDTEKNRFIPLTVGPQSSGDMK